MKKQGFERDLKAVLVLAHGAGAPADSLFMEALSESLAQQNVATVRFEFPYMQKRRQDGRKRPPDRQPKLLEYYASVVDELRESLGADCRLLVGGKSMGGRMASILASERDGIDGVIAFGYPFHPPGKLDRWRVEHFTDVSCPFLVVQGTRDPFGKREELEARGQLPGGAELYWLEGGNHDFQPPVKQQSSQHALIKEAATAAGRFAERIVAS
ncbi:alpha/beta family hydrolase [Marinobacter salinisoli]|nr:alpha/beta family hydrolase [Marinobacter salinisoli]